MKHTPEPWKVGDNPVTKMVEIHAKGGKLCVCATIGADANASRIVECVNACAGINPIAVPKLLEALEHLIAEADDPDNDKPRDLVDAINWEMLRDALASAKVVQ